MRMKSIGLFQLQREDLRYSSEPRLKLMTGSGLFFTVWKNYELLYKSEADEEESIATDNEEGLSILFMIDDEAEED